jgi:hypothetical protein
LVAAIERVIQHGTAEGEVDLASEYVFIDEWDVDAPQEAVFEALADAR